MNSPEGEDPMPVRHSNTLWVHVGGRDFIVCVEQDDGGGRNLLRACHAERDVTRDCAFLFMRGDGKCLGVSPQTCEAIMEAVPMEDFGTPDEWEGTIGMTFGAVVVEMKTLVFEDDECSTLMSKLAEASHLERFASPLRDEGVAEFPVPARSFAGGGSMLSSREEEEKSLEFRFDLAEDASEGKSSMLVFTEDYVIPSTEPSKSDRLSMTKGERKWYSSVWPFDLNFILHVGLTAVEKEWFTRL